MMAGPEASLPGGGGESALRVARATMCRVSPSLIVNTIAGTTVGVAEPAVGGVKENNNLKIYYTKMLTFNTKVSTFV
jgi:hypothetical protein